MPDRRATKQDVALAEVHRKAARELVLARGFVIAIVVAASALPIWALQGLVEPLAGRTTTIDVDVVVGSALGISVVVNVFQLLKGRSHRRELERQRDRMDGLESGAS